MLSEHEYLHNRLLQQDLHIAHDRGPEYHDIQTLVVVLVKMSAGPSAEP